MWPGNLSTHLLFHPVPTAFPGTPDEPPEHQFLLAWGALESPRLVEDNGTAMHFLIKQPRKLAVIKNTEVN